MSSGHLPVNGISMYYEVHGAGHPLVLLHGGLCTIDLNFGALIPALAAHRRVIAVELQGHGHTADTGRPLAIATLADDVVALLDHLGVERADLYGFSLGGWVAFDLAVRHPGRAGHLVLAGEQLLAGAGQAELDDPTRMPTEADFRALRDAYAAVAPDPSHFDAFGEKLTAAVHSFAAWPADTLRTLPNPTLLVYGDHDFVRLEDAVRMHALIPGARLAVLPATKHMDMLDRAGLLLPLIEGFLP